jgi:hypothetical protein
MEAVVNSYAPVGKEATFAVILSDSFGNTHERVVPLKLKSKYQAELAAIKYALQAVPHKDVFMTLKTSVSQVPQIFSKTPDGEWIKRKKPNKLVDDIRELAGQFKEFNCVKETDSELILKTKEMCKSITRI